MNFKHLFGMTGILCATVLVSSCTTTGSAVNADIIKEHSASYQAKGTAAVSNDIKTILMAGGLDASDPSSPTSSTRTAELQKIPSRDQKEVEALVASLSGKPAPVQEIKTSSSPVVVPTAMAQKTPEKPKSEAAAPTTALALVTPQESVTEERFKFPDIGPNLKPGQVINTETAAAVIPVPEVASVSEVKPTPEKFQNVGKTIKKASRPKSDIVYAKPSVQRF
ncbi:hypothetical protein [Rhizobium sp. MHM7A]|uniref:hypothetical protein n=1 Tax=Rhizobium sp. MHM7A TaxID=2583233 RepID=UPI0011060316|nr:hypothetical protein [Rhizobium sp. MHM7A]TLX16995.1 hypothetical protein FFR93_06655 [Rhizobium sp. MHM7A]